MYVERTDPEERQTKRQPPPEVSGWGADLVPDDRPAFPKERTPPRIGDVPPPELQPVTVEVLHSTERPGLTPVFGTTCPPSGVSGSIRRAAFHYSENDVRHWLMLLFADRVNVVEGILDDLAHGHVPDILGEMGIRAEWRYNRAGFVRKALIASAAIGLLVYMARRRGSTPLDDR
ncbi:hypothetical protein H8R02_11580 [Ramlibacter sp. GTP1]|uniref:Uncharacterized protein n=1 Tax=Ramlibacter albus TaxID=2079448 RepID=A0A923S295_9BURK|nr:hypothetical protein [Ramlibacter albus]